MAIAKTVATPIPQYDSGGNLINAAYWHLISLTACPPNQTFVLVYGGFASSASYAADPVQIPLMTQQVQFPSVNQPSATWPFAPSALASNFPNSPLAILQAADAFSLNEPFFSGGSQVS